MNSFPLGKAPLWIMIVATICGIVLLSTMQLSDAKQPDLSFVIFAQAHYDAYQKVIPEFEQAHGVTVQMQVVNLRALQSRLRSALLSGSPVPDMIELSDGSMGFFTKGTIDDVGFVDLTDLIRREGLDTSIVQARFSLWSSRGHIFAMPHDVHPVMLAYRRDLVDSLGIDVGSIRTWDDFLAMGRKITRDLNGDGMIDRYAIDLPAAGSSVLRTLLLQRGVSFFDSLGRIAVDPDAVADAIMWYTKASEGPGRIAYPCGWGQNLTQAMIDGLCLFYFAPDWRTKQFERDAPVLQGKMALMPLPAWYPGGRRTSTWGGTGLAITKACKNKELAWEFAKFLYYKENDLGARFLTTNIIPPHKDFWNLPELQQPNQFYSGQSLGMLYASLAPEIPPFRCTAYSQTMDSRINQIYASSLAQYKTHGGTGFREYILQEIQNQVGNVRKSMERNRFLKIPSQSADVAAPLAPGNSSASERVVVTTRYDTALPLHVTDSHLPYSIKGFR